MKWPVRIRIYVASQPDYRKEAVYLPFQLVKTPDREQPSYDVAGP
jgi:hypothetical protein